jgi:hypothetical protein
VLRASEWGHHLLGANLAPACACMMVMRLQVAARKVHSRLCQDPVLAAIAAGRETLMSCAVDSLLQSRHACSAGALSSSPAPELLLRTGCSAAHPL